MPRVTRAVLGADDREMKLVRKAFEIAGIPTVDAQAPRPSSPPAGLRVRRHPRAR